MDVVLGLSVTPTTAGWVLSEGHSADGVILEHGELPLVGADGNGVHPAGAAEQIATAVRDIKDRSQESAYRLRVVGVTWTDSAAAHAAVLIELLTESDFDNIVAVSHADAVEHLAEALATVIGYERTVVCFLDQEPITVAMVDTTDGVTRAAVKRIAEGFDRVLLWLSGMFERNPWQPAGVVVVGREDNVEACSAQLERALPVPVFVQSMAQVTVARGAALAAASSTEFTDDDLVVESASAVAGPRPTARSGRPGVATVLAAASVVFVASVSLVLGIQFEPGHRGHAPKRSIPAATGPSTLSSRPPADSASGTERRD